MGSETLDSKDTKEFQVLKFLSPEEFFLQLFQKILEKKFFFLSKFIKRAIRDIQEMIFYFIKTFIEN